MHSFVNRAHRYPFYSAAGGRRRRALGRVSLRCLSPLGAEDIGRINILLFSETLSAWCGETLTQPGAPAANSTCYGCPWLRLCRCGEQEDPLCAGYRQFYDFSGPYMRVMRDLRRQQRPPEALMPLLR
jgi:uncharacterized protein